MPDDKQLEKKIAQLEDQVAFFKQSIEDMKEKHALCRVAFDNMFEFVALLTPYGQILDVNRVALDFIGCEKADVLDKYLWEAEWWTGDPELQEEIRFAVQIASKRQFARRDLEYPMPDGTVQYLDFSILPVLDETGKVVYLVSEARLITKYKLKEYSLSESENRFRTIYEHAPIMIDSFDENGNCILWNKECEKWLGWSKADIVAHKNPLVLTYPDKQQRSGVQASVMAADGIFREWQPIAKDGTSRVQRWANFRLPDEVVISIGYDITDIKKVESELKLLTLALEKSNSIIFITDKDGYIEYVNAVFENVTGFSREEAIGQKPNIIASGEMDDTLYDSMWETINAGHAWHGDLQNKNKNGKPIWVHAMIMPIKEKNGEITHFLSIQENITGIKAAEKRASFLKSYDDLTGLPNREKFIEVFEQKINEGHSGVLILLDVDGLKEINSTYGRNTGDEFLKFLSVKIKKSIAKYHAEYETVLARLGDDDFLLSVDSISGEDGFALADNLRKIIAEVSFTEKELNATLSVGIVLYPNEGRSASGILSKVDAAVFRAKELGGNNCYLYSTDDYHINNPNSRKNQKKKLLAAIDGGDFVIWYQPIMDLCDGSIHHYEALVRMRDNDGKIILPGAFIQSAESFGLIGSIDRLVAKKIIQLQAEHAHDEVTFAMNISGKEVGDDQLLEFLVETIIETGVNPKSLIFEITETAAIKDLERAVTFINTLKEIGCKFALDNFGLGFTSFIYLREMPVDFIKIDGVFVKAMAKNRSDRDIVAAITRVAHGLGIKIIAEFVEDKETIGYLKNIGVDYAQGFVIGRPSPNIS